MNIGVKTVYGDYEVPDNEVEFHDWRIDVFKRTLPDLFLQQGFHVTTTPVIEAEYYPEKRKFKIIKMSRGYRSSIKRTLDVNPEFVRQYIISNQYILYI